jgi:hypothetical protein
LPPAAIGERNPSRDGVLAGKEPTHRGNTHEAEPSMQASRSRRGGRWRNLRRIGPERAHPERAGPNHGPDASETMRSGGPQRRRPRLQFEWGHPSARDGRPGWRDLAARHRQGDADASDPPAGKPRRKLGRAAEVDRAAARAIGTARAPNQGYWLDGSREAVAWAWGCAPAVPVARIFSARSISSLA